MVQSMKMMFHFYLLLFASNLRRLQRRYQHRCKRRWMHFKSSRHGLVRSFGADGGGMGGRWGSFLCWCLCLCLCIIMSWCSHRAAYQHTSFRPHFKPCSYVYDCPHHHVWATSTTSLLSILADLMLAVAKAEAEAVAVATLAAAVADSDLHR